MGRVEAPVGETRTGTEKLKPWRSLMNGMRWMVIGLTAAAFLGLHVDVGSLFLVMASAAQPPRAEVCGIRGSPGRAPLVHG